MVSYLFRALAVGAAALALLLVFGCGGSSDSATQTARNTTSVSATPTSGSGQQNGEAGYDITISGLFEAEWKSGARDGSGSSCTVAADGFTSLSVYGQIDGKPYGLGISQNNFTEGSFSYPSGTAAAANTPFIQIATTTDATVDWTASSSGLGSGTAIITGGGGRQVSVKLNLDLYGRNGEAQLHVSGPLVCPSS